jgi:hypothetical protein
MSVVYQCLGRGLLQANPQLNANLRFLCTSQKLERRKKCNQLKQPEDKSNIILGKTPVMKDRVIEGVSDIQYPILLKWNTIKRIETCNPALSGDLGGLEDFGKVDLTQPPVHLEDSKEIEVATDEVKRILSLEYSRKKEYNKKLRKNLVSKIQRHKLDMDSDEVKIAVQTVKIRNWQHMLIQMWPYKNQPVKHKLTFTIAARRNALERLRKTDYRKYEWILEKLNLFYKPVPKYCHMEISRKASIERLTDLWCDELKKHRLTKYQRDLEAQQPEFLRNKAAKLQHIISEEAELGLSPTVTQDQVDECIKRAEEIEAKLSEENYEEETLLLYSEEAAQEKNFIN